MNQLTVSRFKTRARQLCARARDQLRDRLNRPNLRWLLGWIVSLAATISDRRPCRIRWTGTEWAYYYDGQVILSNQLLKPAQFDSDLEIFLWDYTPKDGDVILDIGAGTGTEAVRLSRLVGPTGHVIAVEAHPAAFAVLAKVSAANRIHNITIVEAAVADSAGTLRITDNDEVGSNTLYGNGAIEVRATTIDEVVAEQHIERVDFLKMNIEGAERLAIQGMNHAVATVDRMAISCHDFLGTEWGATRSVVYRWLIDQGFQVRSRPDDPRPWCQDYLYASRPGAKGCVRDP